MISIILSWRSVLVFIVMSLLSATCDSPVPSVPSPFEFYCFKLSLVMRLQQARALLFAAAIPLEGALSVCRRWTSFSSCTKPGFSLIATSLSAGRLFGRPFSRTFAQIERSARGHVELVCLRSPISHQWKRCSPYESEIKDEELPSPHCCTLAVSVFFYLAQSLFMWSDTRGRCTCVTNDCLVSV
jgi:hypothetical protein